MSRIKVVEREYLAMRQAAARFANAARHDPTILEGRLRHGDIVKASENLEGTYLIRLFAEFETGVRQFWGAHWGTIPGTEALLNGLAARRGVPITQRDDAHRVRDYRNALVHEREELSIAEARGFLCHFFSYRRVRYADRLRPGMVRDTDPTKLQIQLLATRFFHSPVLIFRLISSLAMTSKRDGSQSNLTISPCSRHEYTYVPL